VILAHSLALRGNFELPAGLIALSQQDFQCFYSELPQDQIGTQADILRFFHANQELFRQGDLLEFRYPTALPDLGALKDFLAAHASSIASELQRLKGSAQLTVYFPRGAPESAAQATSGTAYLESRRNAQRAQATLVERVRTLAEEDRDVLVEGQRMLLLLPRQKATDVAGRISSEMHLEVAGPFPPSAFAKLLS
jgi:hypothetical protein